MSSNPRDQIMYAGLVADSGAADNATATATLTPDRQGDMQGQFVLTGFTAGYSAAVAAIRTITISYTKGGSALTYTYSHDFTLGALNCPLPGTITCDRNTVATAALPASGAGGTTGRIYLFATEM